MSDKIMKNPSLMKARPGTASPPARPFQCQWHEGCPKSFNRKSDLQRHYRIHTNERPYACDYKPCEKTFIQRSALTVHRRTHTGDKPHKCPYVGCGKCFSDSSSLARHRRIHTNDKPYICRSSQCRKAFCRKTTMTKHFRKEHPNESLDQEEDADYSDVEPSDDEPSLEHDVDSPSSAEYPFDHRQIKCETPSNAAASNYNANLWRLPAQTAQRSSQHAIKLQRSLSGSSQRGIAEPAVSPQCAGGYIPRSNTLPSNVPRSHGVDMAMWQASPLNSPSSISPNGDFGMQGIPTPTSTPTHFQTTHSLPIRRTSLQSVTDIIMDDPSYHRPPQPLAPGPPQPHIQPAPDYRDEMPQTPAPGQQLPQFQPPMDDQPLLIEAYQVPHVGVPGGYSLSSTGQGVNLQDPYDLYKELKMEENNTYSQMPDAVYY